MKSIIEHWLEGLSWLFTDDLISFYTYFTVIFAECAYLWSHYTLSTALPFTIILLVYVLNVLIFSWLNGYSIGGIKAEKKIKIAYIAVFLIPFVIGCFFDPIICLLLTLVPTSITFIWIIVRTLQDTYYEGTIPGLFRNKIFYIFSQIVVVGAPFIVFVIFLAIIPALPIVLKILIPIIYLLLIPFISYYEDSIGTALNIFEIAFDGLM